MMAEVSHTPGPWNSGMKVVLPGPLRPGSGKQICLLMEMDLHFPILPQSLFPGLSLNFIPIFHYSFTEQQPEAQGRSGLCC